MYQRHSTVLLGHRTVCVVTKLDLVEPGTDVTSLLNGHDIALHHSKVLKVIGVINRSQINAENPRWVSYFYFSQ
jgi:hypothetical protein